jgi:hypothetical protein
MLSDGLHDVKAELLPVNIRRLRDFYPEDVLENLEGSFVCI